jgi:hypothetical protein
MCCVGCLTNGKAKTSARRLSFEKRTVKALAELRVAAALDAEAELALFVLPAPFVWLVVVCER